MAVGSASKVARWRRCRHRVWYGDIMELQRTVKSIAPVRGTILHECLNNFYTGKDWADPIKDLKMDLENVFDEERAEWGSMPKELYRIMRGYLMAYKHIDHSIKTLATEVHFEIPLGERHTYQGYIDWIFEDERGVWVADHKTVKTLPKPQDLYMDLQTLMYYEAARTDPKLKALIGDRPLAGVVFNHIRTKAPREPQVLKSGGISKAACDTDVATYFEAVKRAGLDIHDYEDMIEKLKGNVFFRRSKIPVSERTIQILKDEIRTTLSEVDYYTKLAKTESGEVDPNKKVLFPRNMMKQRCDWDCEFRDVCYGELAGMKIDNLLKDNYEIRGGRTDDSEIDE